jgi:hypothetical protein
MQTDGHRIHAYTAESRPVQSTLSNSPLDAAIGEILEISPAFGRSMINGQLKASGHEVTRECIVASYLRVHGAPGSFGDRSIHRKAYKVAGATLFATTTDNMVMYLSIYPMPPALLPE